MPKLNEFSPAINCVRNLRTKIFIEVFSVSQFVCASCNASYVDEMHRHLTARTDEHFSKDKKSHMYQHLMSWADCLNACSRDWFSILDIARTRHRLHIRKSLFISWLKPTLTNKSHTNTSFLCPFDISCVSSVSLYFIWFLIGTTILTIKVFLIGTCSQSECKFIKLDIKEFYSSITEKMLMQLPLQRITFQYQKRIFGL